MSFLKFNNKTLKKKLIIGLQVKNIITNRKLIIIYFHQKSFLKNPKDPIPSIAKNKQNIIIV